MTVGSVVALSSDRLAVRRVAIQGERSLADLHREAVRAAVAQERDRCVALVLRYLSERPDSHMVPLGDLRADIPFEIRKDQK